MKILIPLDGSKFAENVLEPAAKLANRAGAEVHLLEVVRESEVEAPRVASRSAENGFWEEAGWMLGGHPGSPERPIETGTRVETVDEIEEPTRSMAEEYLDNVARRFFSGVTRREVVIGNDPAEEILEYARREGVEFIAMATHGRTGLAKRLLGSVAAKLLSAHVAPLFLVGPGKLHEGEH